MTKGDEPSGGRAATAAQRSRPSAWAGEVDFRALADAMPALVFVADASGANLYTNGRFHAYTGRSAEALLGGGWLEAIDARDRACADAYWRTVVATQEPYEAEYRFVSADGEARWFAVRATPVREGGRIVRWVGHATDIDDQKRTEAARAAELAAVEHQRRGEATSPEYRVVRPDGTERHVRDAASPVFGLEGRPTQVVGAVEDVSELRRAGEAGASPAADVLQPGPDTPLAAVVDGAGLGTWRWDLLQNAFQFGQHWGAMLGYAEDEVEAVAARWDSVVHPEDQARLDQAVQDHLEGRTPVYRSEHRLKHKDGRWIWVLDSGRVTERDAEGRPLVVVGTHLDITSRKEAEAALAERERFLRTLIDALPDCVKVCSPDGRLLDMNAAGLAMLDVPSIEPLQGQDPLLLVDEADRPAWARAQAGAAKGQASGWIEFGITSVAGLRRRMEGRAIPLLDVQGTVDAVLWVTRDITARKTDEEALRLSEARAQDRLAEIEQVYRYAPVGLFTFDRDYRFTRINERMAAINGLPVEAHLGCSMWEVVPDLADHLLEVYRPVLERGEPVLEVELHGETPAQPGVKRDFLASYFPQRTGTGEVVGLIGAVLEVTDRKRAQERLRLALEGGRLGTWDWNVATGAVELDERWLRMRGYAPGEIEPRIEAVVAGTHPEDMPHVQAALQEHMEGRSEDYAAEFRFRRKDGSWMWVASRGQVYQRDAEGQPLRITGVEIDVTEQRTAQAALAASEARWRGLFEHMHEGVGLGEVVRDADSRAVDLRFLEVNGGFERQSGLPASVVGQLISEAVPGLEPHWIEFYARVAKTGEPAQAEYHAAPLGRWFEARAHRTGPDRFATLFLDVTARHEADAALAESQARLERLNAELEARVADRTASLHETALALEAEMRRREEAQERLLQAQKLEALGQVVGSVAHDFNNVLAAVQGTFNLLERRIAEDSLRFIIGEGRKAGDRAAALVRQMLAFARRQTANPEVVEPARLLPDLEGMIRHAVGPSVACVFDVPEEVWPVRVDPSQLEMAVLNLAVNARDAMPEGGTLTVRARNLPAEATSPGEFGRGDRVEIAVVDTGSGMDEATLARAFEPFFTTKSVGQGTGLGLAQVHGFVAASGGEVRADSAPGRGTTVSLVLPRSALRSAMPLPETETIPDLHGGATILLVDDDDQVRRVTAALLRDLGYTVVEASNAAAARAMAQLHPVHLLLTDVVMPGTDGLTLARSLRAERPDLPVLFMTGYAGKHDLAGEAVVTKPFTGEEMGRQVLEALGREGSGVAAQAH